MQLVVFALRHPAQCGVPHERLVELTGWDNQLVNEALARSPDPRLIARMAPAVLDPDAVARAAAGIEATTRLQAPTQRILADVGDEAWSSAPDDLADLHERLDAEMALVAPGARTTAAVTGLRRRPVTRGVACAAFPPTTTGR